MSCFSHIQVSTCCLHYRCHKLGKRCTCLFGEPEATFVGFEYRIVLNVVCFIIMMLLYSDQSFLFPIFHNLVRHQGVQFYLAAGTDISIS